MQKAIAEMAQKGRTIPLQEDVRPTAHRTAEIRNNPPKENNGAKEIDLTREEQKTVERSVPKP